MTLVDQIHATLTAHPWGLTNPAQRVDLAAWLNGLPEGRITSLEKLTPGERQVTLDRITGERDHQDRVQEWLTERARQAVEAIWTPEQVVEAGAGWLL